MATALAHSANRGFGLTPCFADLPFLIVSTIAVALRRWATFTGMNFPVLASRPILRDLPAISIYLLSRALARPYQAKPEEEV